MRFFSYLMMILVLQACANLYKERSYVSDVSASGKMKGLCSSSGAQNRFSIDGHKGQFTVSLPIHYDYWWVGPVVFPVFPKSPERKDPSFIKITVESQQRKLIRDELLKSELMIKNNVEPVLPINVVTNRTAEKDRDSFTIQFEAPKLIDLPEFRLKLPASLTNEVLVFRLATDTHYVPILPVVISDCVVD